MRLHVNTLGLACMLLASASDAEGWQTSGAVYTQIAGITGETGVGPITSDLDVSFNDLLDNLKVAGMLAVRTENESYAISLHALYIGLEDEGNVGAGSGYVAEFNQDLIEASWSWKFSDRYEAFIGARYQSLGSEITVSLPNGTRTTSAEVKRWVDPIVGGRVVYPWGEKWNVIARLDVGGFGIGSELTWSALIALDWAFSESLGLVLGYRALDTDYESGSGNERFLSDTRVAGPLLGIRFNFY